MNIKRIVPNIHSGKMAESRKFYEEFIGLRLIMDMGWILTFGSVSNPDAQVSIIKKELPDKPGTDVAISFEVADIDGMYSKALALEYKIPYPIVTEEWGVRRFFVEDPNGVLLNIMNHTG